MTDILDEDQILVDPSTIEPPYVQRINKIGRLTAYVSFGIGTLLLLLYVGGVSHSIGEKLLVIGLGYVGIAFAVNCLIFMLVFISLFKARNRRQVFATMGLMLLNLPISFGYFLLVVNGH